MKYYLRIFGPFQQKFFLFENYRLYTELKTFSSRSPDSSSCSSRDPSPCARAPGSIQHAPVIRRQSTTEEILIARGFRRQSTTEEMIRCRNFRRQSSQSDDTVCILPFNI